MQGIAIVCALVLLVAMLVLAKRQRLTMGNAWSARPHLHETPDPEHEMEGKEITGQVTELRMNSGYCRREMARTFTRLLFLAPLVGSMGVLGGCGEGGGFWNRFIVEQDEIIVERRPDPAYDRLFPYYVELCTTSQFRPKTGSLGGVAGHAVMYIKGACKDEDAPFPTLRRCRTVANNADDPEHGVGVSVNRWLRNVNWLAFPGNGLFFKGNLKPGETLTQAHFDATVRDAIDKGVYDGVEFHDFPAGGDLENFVTNHSIGTDFALQFARSVFCARVPVTEPVLDEVIAFLNDKNEEYATGEADYNWSVLADNCVHTLRNALAAANFWSPISVREVKFRQFFNLAVPANEFVNLGRLGAEGPMENYRAIRDDDPLRDALHEFRWLPTRHGALLKALPVHEPNDLFDTTMRMFALQSPFRIGKTQDAVRLLGDARFVDLRANLEHFRDKYDTILAERDDRVERLATVRGDPYRRVERLHYDYIQAQRDEVDAMLKRLAKMEAGTAETRFDQTATVARYGWRATSGAPLK